MNSNDTHWFFLVLVIIAAAAHVAGTAMDSEIARIQNSRTEVQK